MVLAHPVEETYPTLVVIGNVTIHQTLEFSLDYTHFVLSVDAKYLMDQLNVLPPL